MKRPILALACCATLLAGCAVLGGRPRHSGIDLAGGDPTVRPQDDLFGHVNGKWVRSDRDSARQGVHRDLGLARTTRCRSNCAACSSRGEAPRRRRRAQDRRLLRELHGRGRGRDRPASRPLAGELAAIDADRSRRPSSRAPMGRPRAARRRHADLARSSTRTRATRRATSPSIAQGGLGLPDRDYYLDDGRRQAGRRARQVRSRTWRKMLGAGRRRATPPSDAERGRRARDRAGARRSGRASRTAIRSRPTTRSTIAQLPQLAPGFDWKPGSPRPASPARRRRRSSASRATCGGFGEARRAHAAAGLEGLLAHGTCCDAYAPYLAQGLRRRALRVLRHDAVAARPQNQPRWKRGVDARRRRRWARRSASSTSTKYFPPETQGAHGRAGRRTCSPRSASASTTLDWMSADDQEARRRPSSPSSRRRSATRTSGATTRALDDQRGRPGRQRRCARATFEYDAQPRQARQAGRPRRVGHDAADRQRLLQPAS